MELDDMKLRKDRLADVLEEAFLTTTGETRACLHKMLSMGQDEGTVTLKLNLKMLKGMMDGRELNTPEIRYSVVRAVPIKDETKGKWSDPQYELEDDGGVLGLYKVEDPQTNIFDER